MAKTKLITATLHLRDLDWEVTGSYTPGSSDYWDRAAGCYYPGDPDEVEVDVLKGDGHDGALEADDLTKQELEACEQALVLAAGEDR